MASDVERMVAERIRNIRAKVNEIDRLLSTYEEKYKEKTGKTALTIFLAYIDRNIDWPDVGNLHLYLKGLKREMIKNKVDEVHVILTSDGGDPNAAYLMSRVLHRFGQELNANIIYVIPRFAKSAATLMALGGSEIRMTEVAELGPVDPQVRFGDSWVSAKTLRSSMSSILQAGLHSMYSFLQQQSNGIDQHTSQLLRTVVDVMIETTIKKFQVIGSHESYIEHMKQLAKELLTLSMFPEEMKGTNQDRSRVDKIAKVMTEEFHSHGMAIDYQRAIELGLKVSKVDDELEDILLDAFQIYMDILRIIFLEIPGPRFMPYYWKMSRGMIVMELPPDIVAMLSKMEEKGDRSPQDGKDIPKNEQELKVGELAKQ